MATKSGCQKNARKGGSEEGAVFKSSVSARHALDRCTRYSCSSPP
jgi:hypothetical protein